MTKNPFLELVAPLAREGGKILKENFGRLTESQVHEKTPGDLVTDLDRLLEKKYAEAIREAFPEHAIVGEEGARRNAGAEYQWIIDPLDGTNNFVHGRPRFCTMLCLFHHDSPVVSVIYEPLSDQLFTAVKGEGSFCNGKTIRVSGVDDPKKSSLLYCEGRHSEKKDLTTRLIPEIEKTLAQVTRFSAGHQMARVAEGSAEVCLMNEVAVWDVAPGVLIIQEAGGRVTTFDGSDWKPGVANTLMTNGTDLHEKMVRILNR